MQETKAMVILEEYCTESTTLRLPLLAILSSFMLKILSGFTFREDGTVNRSIANFFDFFTTVSPGRCSYGVSSQDIVIDADTGVSIRVYIPSIHTDLKRALPVVMYFHGGGFTVLSPKIALYDSFCRNMCRSCNVIVVSVDYRLAPEHRYPVALDDCFLSLKWVQENGPSINANLSSCFLMGDSSGANIAHFVYCMAVDDAEKLRPLQIKGNLLLFPFFGGLEITQSEIRVNDPVLTRRLCDWYWTAYLPVGTDRDHPACNVFGPQDHRDYSRIHFPPSLVIVSEHDLLKDRQLVYVQGLKAYCKDVQFEYYKGGFHCFHMFGKSKPYMDLMAKVQDFIAARVVIN